MTAGKKLDHISIREAFLRFFEERGHRRVPSSPLVPAEDPTLLFTNAGMNQFKDVFLGREERDYRRAASCQKCMRVSGKHNDFENVGHTPRHQTFFEMLGNFSFGDYFKREAIRYGWDLLVEGYGIDGDRIHATVFEEDDEAAELWVDEVSLPAARVHRLGASENFWSMGETGPCGPCSELHWDYGRDYGCGDADCPGPGHDCGRYYEIWNLVFMQFERSAGGEMRELPSPSVDTGMGMERLTALLQGVDSNYDTDLFRPILDRLSDITDTPYGRRESSDVSLRICADHLRAAVFLIGDGVIPSNEGRGYVLRKLLRRALQHGRRLGMEDPFLYRAVGSVVETMGDVYDQLEECRTLAEKTMEQEERSFARVLENGDAEFEQIVRRLEERGDGELPGTDAFRLHDTFGYPRERLEEMARERGYQVRWAEFEAEMEAQRAQSREASSLGEVEDEELTAALAEVPATEFTGYAHPSGEWIEQESCEILALFDEGGRRVASLEGAAGTVVLDRTPFYAESGGQVGDSGELLDPFSGKRLAAVETATYVGPPSARHTLHHFASCGNLAEGSNVTARVPAAPRWDTMRNHTATHLLHQALKEVLGEHVRQAGSVVEPARLRFDYNHYEAPSPEQLRSVEDRVNEKILEDLEVTARVLPIQEAREMGAQMLFGEKYGEQVRVLSVGGFEAGDYSREFCGGTHVRATGEIGLLRLTQERGIAAGVRRIEAVTGRGLLEHVREGDDVLHALERDLNVPRREIAGRVSALRTRIRELEKEEEELRYRLASGKASGTSHVSREETISDLKVVAEPVPEMDVGGLRNLADEIRGKRGADVLGLASDKGGKVAFVVALSPKAADSLDAVRLLRRVAAVAGGGGGGRPDMAWGGGGEPEKIDEALRAVFDAVREEGGGQ